MKVLGCPTCRRKFSTLKKMNQHIGKTGCNEGNKISKEIMIKICGLKIT